MELGYSRPLEQSDLWALDEREKTATVGAQFQEALKQTRDPVRAPHVRLLGTSQCGQGGSTFVLAGLLYIISHRRLTCD